MSSKQGIARLRISDVVASARIEQNGFGPSDPPAAPSLGSPSRPKTPANFDDMPSMKHHGNQITNLLAGAASRNRKATGKAYQSVKSSRSGTTKIQSTPDIIDVEPVRKSPTLTQSTAVYNPPPISRIDERKFNPSQLLNDLSYIQDTLTISGYVTLDEMFTDEIEAFIKFLQSSRLDLDQDSGLIGSIEEIIMKLSGVPIIMLSTEDSDPLQVLSVLRLNLRVLVKILDTIIFPSAPTSNTSAGGGFDVALVSMVLSQVTEALSQLCSRHAAPGASGSLSLQFVSLLSSPSEENISGGDNNYEDLDDCEIEEENEDGTYAPLRPASSSAAKSLSNNNNASTAQTNGEMVGVSMLNAILTALWPRANELVKLLAQHSHYADFVAENMTLLESLLHTASNICIVYKYLSADETDCRWLSSAAVLPVLAMGLKLYTQSTVVHYINSTYSNDPSANSVYIDCLCQILAVVRNFSVVKSCQKELLSHSVTPVLCTLLGVYTTHSKVVVNCARVLAKVSVSERGREQINSKERHLKHLVDVVLREAAHSGGGTTTATGEAVEWPSLHTWAILTRVCYTLGNLTTSNENNRVLIGSLGLTGVAHKDRDDPLVDLLASCGMALSSMFGAEDQHDEDGSDDGSEEDEQDSRSAERELVDATVKLVRLLANLSMNADIGRVLGSKNVNALEMLVKMLVSVREGSSAGQEELLLNVIAACTNLTYYSSKYINENITPSTPSRSSRASVSDRLLDLSQQLSVHLVTCLTTHANIEIQLESARVLGNLTRIESVRRSLVSTYGADLLLDLLKHPQWEVVAAVAGVLVNLSADTECKRALLASKALVPLSWLLRKVGLEDPELSTLLCQALYNLLLHTSAADTAHMHNKLSSTLETLISIGMEESKEAGSKNAEYLQVLSQFLKVGIAVQKLVVQQRAEVESQTEQA